MARLCFVICMLFLMSQASIEVQAAKHLPYSANTLQQDAAIETAAAKTAEDEAEIWLTPSFLDEKETQKPAGVSYVEIVAAGMKPMLTSQPTSADLRFKEGRKTKGIKEWWNKLKAQLGGGETNDTNTNVNTTETTTTATIIDSSLTTAKVHPVARAGEANETQNAINEAVQKVSDAVSSNTTSSMKMVKARFRELIRNMVDDDNITATAVDPATGISTTITVPVTNTTTAASTSFLEDNSTMLVGDNATLASFLEEQLSMKLAEKRNVFDWVKKVQANFFDLFRSHKASAKVATNSTAAAVEEPSNSTATH